MPVPGPLQLLPPGRNSLFPGLAQQPVAGPHPRLEGLVLLPAGLLLLLNIPTAIFILIYRTTRKRRRQDRDIDKMNIQDL